MKQMLLFLLACALCMMPAAMAQDKDKHADESAMPKALDDAMSKWMVGEWSGTGESNMGAAKEWETCTMSLDNQFVEMHMTSQFTKVNPEFVKNMSAMMKMTEQQTEQAMKSTTYKGMGVLTLDPKTNEYVGYWFDSMRGMYKGTGKLEGNKIVMIWEGSGGSSTRTIEKDEKGRMVQSFTEKDPMGNVVEGKSTYARKKK